MNVWVIEDGEYSDYRVVGVFSSQENAQIVADAIKAESESSYSEATIAVWPLDPAVDELRQGLKCYHIWMQRDGTVERCHLAQLAGDHIGGEVGMWRRSVAAALFKMLDKPDVLDAKVWAKDDQHAVKIANEHRTRLIASGEWDADLVPRA